MRFLFVLLTIATTLSGCAVVSARLPLPLPDGGITVGGFGGVSGGQEPDSDIAVPYALAFGGGTVGWQALTIDRFALELDAALGAGARDANSFPETYVGGAAGARLWFREDGWALGIDASAAGFFEVARRPQSGRAQRLLQLDVRALWVVRLDDEIWIGTRPGVVLPLSNNADYRIPLLDVPLALIWSPNGFRFGVEIGVLGPVFPSSIHIGASGSVVF